ncbi:hypothetical protein CMI37_25755 [Candidatus Pacearchaeota archaeon]|nr:hypothetical protein [Candidatus Pacearchaeota archaeon]
MAQTNRIGRHMTTIESINGRIYVRYWDTDVVQFDNQWITLDHGGYKTQTTKLRMNQTASQFGLGFGVYQKNYKWFVTCPQGDVIPWGSGRRVTLSRIKQ